MMTLYQKFLDLTGLVHISEADFNAALDPKTDAQKALHDFIKWSVGKTDANPDAASFRKDFNTTHEDHKADVHNSVLSSPTVPTHEDHKAEVTDTVLSSPTAHETVASEDHKADVHDSVVTSLTTPDSNVVTNSETVSTHTVASETESAVSEPSTLVVK